MSQHINLYQGSSIERWLTGHHLFFVEIQAIILAIHVYDQAPTDRNLQTVADLIRGSATSMQFAGNFTRAAYDPVRQSMAHLAEGFSGLLSADHRVLMRELKKLKRAADSSSPAYHDLKDAIEVAYKAHAHVCERFVGDAGSLANKDGTAWKTILSRYLPRALSRIGVLLQMPSQPAGRS
jgi:hypothetical protein